MDQHLVMTILGKDRPGLVEKVADTVARHGGNWLESRMCRLGGEFAGILRVSIPSESVNSFEQQLTALETDGMSLTLRRDTPDNQQVQRSFTQMEIIGHDRPGIVREISKALAQAAVNVEELETTCVSAPMSGEMLFKANARLRVPVGADMQALRQKLERIATDLTIDIALSEHSRL